MAHPTGPIPSPPNHFCHKHPPQSLPGSQQLTVAQQLSRTCAGAKNFSNFAGSTRPAQTGHAKPVAPLTAHSKVLGKPQLSKHGSAACETTRHRRDETPTPKHVAPHKAATRNPLRPLQRRNLETPKTVETQRLNNPLPASRSRQIRAAPTDRHPAQRHRPPTPRHQMEFPATPNNIGAQRNSPRRLRNVLPLHGIRRSRRPAPQTVVAVPRQTPPGTSQHATRNLLCPNGFRLKTMKLVLPQQHSTNSTAGGSSAPPGTRPPARQNTPQNCCATTHFTHILRDLFCPNRFHANTARHRTGHPACNPPLMPQNNCATTGFEHGTTKPVVPQQISGASTTPVPYPRAATMPRTMPQIAPILLCPNTFRYPGMKPVLPQQISPTKQVPQPARGRHRIPPYPPIPLRHKTSR